MSNLHAKNPMSNAGPESGAVVVATATLAVIRRMASKSHPSSNVYKKVGPSVVIFIFFLSLDLRLLILRLLIILVKVTVIVEFRIKVSFKRLLIILVKVTVIIENVRRVALYQSCIIQFTLLQKTINRGL